MATGSTWGVAGKVRMTPRGQWSQYEEYDILDLVSNEDKTIYYVAKMDVPLGTLLTNTDYWCEIINVDEIYHELDDIYQEAAKENENFNHLMSEAMPTQIESGDLVKIDNSVSLPLVGLKLYGKSKKSGTPATITNVGDSGSVEVISCGKNLLSLSITSQTIAGVSFDVNSNGTIIVNGPRNVGTNSVAELGTVTLPAGDYILSGGARNNDFYLQILLPGASAVGESNGVVEFTLEDSTLVTVRMFMRGSTTAPHLLFSPMIRVASISNSDFQSHTEVSSDIPTINGLAGLQVTATDDYTYVDVEGNYWLCDEIDFERSLYIRRIGNKTFNEMSNEISAGTGFFQADLNMAFIKSALLCTIYETNTTATSAAEMDDFEIMRNNNPNTYSVIIKDSRYDETTLEDFISAIGEARILYALATPEEIPLTEAQLNAFAQLNSYYRNTIVFAVDSVQPMLEVKACVDIPTRIDNGIQNNPTIQNLVTKLPNPPTEDGTYQLQVVVSNGENTYSWEAV